MHVTNLVKLPPRGTIGLDPVVPVDVAPRFATWGETPPEPQPAARTGTVAAAARRRVRIAVDSYGGL